MPFWRCYYHLVWATKYRQPLLTGSIEPILYSAIEQKCRELQCELMGMNNVADHIHLALTIPPSLSVARVLATLKGTSSHKINHTFDLPSPLQWQKGYAVLTFGEKVMPHVLEYIARQKEHHAQNTTLAYLEQLDNNNL